MHRQAGQDNDRRLRRRGGDGQVQQPPEEVVLIPSAGARLTHQQLQQSPVQDAPDETHVVPIPQAVVDPEGLQILDQTGSEVVPEEPPDMIPRINLVNANDNEAVAGYSLVRRIRKLEHAPGWGELWAGISFTRVSSHTYRTPLPGRYVAIKKLNKQVVDAYLQCGRGPFVQRDLSFLDEEYIQDALRVQDRENPFKEMSRMDEFGDNIHVLRQIEFLQDTKYIYIIMPYATGRISLDNAIAFERQQELSPREAHNLFVQILRILAYLEKNGIHHRDLSPDNFIFLEPDRIVVMDLAMSVRIPVDSESGQRTLIRRMGTFGTPAFMCPEIFHNFQVFDGISADLWSAMLILYAMLTHYPLYLRPDAAIDISYRFYVVARGITQNPINELIVEVVNDVMDEDADQVQIRNRHILWDQAQAHLGLPPNVRNLFHFFFRINPSERFTLAQVMESDYVRFGDD